MVILAREDGFKSFHFDQIINDFLFFTLTRVHVRQVADLIRDQFDAKNAFFEVFKSQEGTSDQ